LIKKKDIWRVPQLGYCCSFFFAVNLRTKRERKKRYIASYMYIYKRQEGGRITKCFDYTLETTIAITPDGDGVRRRRKCPRQTKKGEPDDQTR